MIIKTGDFKLDAFIPNVDDAPNSEILGNDNELQGFIDKFEEEILIRLLGWELYSELMTQFTDGVLDPNADEKWGKLVNGFENYRGMSAMIVGYVFWKFIESDDSHYSSAGVVRETSENSEYHESRPKAIGQYRVFYEHAIGNYYQAGLYVKTGMFGGLVGVIHSGAAAGGSNFKSLYIYLQDNFDIFPTWAPEKFKNKNYFDA